MKLSKKQLVLTLCTVLWTAFIFGNSLQSSADSNSMTYSVIGFLEPLLRAAEALFGEADWFFILRKTAHMVEFAVLGVAAKCLADTFAETLGRPFTAHAILYALIVAVTDELIQYFTGRTGAVYDVVIDFGGVLIGVGVVVTAVWLCRRVRRRHEERMVTHD